MFDYTRAAFRKIVDDFKKIDFIRCVLTQGVYIAYLNYAVCIGAGLLAVNIALLTLATAYFAFFLYMKIYGVQKQIKARVKQVYKWSKRLIKLFNLGVMIYGLSVTANHFTSLSLILSSLMIVGWVLEILFDVVFKFFLNKAKLIMEGMEADYKNVTKPVTTVGNFFKKLSGKQVEPEPEPTKNRITLDKLVAQERAQKAEERTRSKAKFSLWLQDKFPVFHRKKDIPVEKNTVLEQLPAPLEEESDTDFLAKI